MKSIGSQLKKFTGQGLPSLLVYKPQRYAPFSRLSWFPISQGLQLGLWQSGHRGPKEGGCVCVGVCELKATRRNFGPCKHS